LISATNWIAPWNNDFTGRSVEDEHGHGTAVAGVAGATVNNAPPFGVASPGGPGAEAQTLVNLRIAVDDHPAVSAGVAAIWYATEHQIPVLNMSWGKCVRPIGARDDEELYPLRDALHNAFLLGHLCVAASGNAIDPLGHCPGGSAAYPAGFDRFVLGVGHVASNDTRTVFLEGHYLDVVTPGGARPGGTTEIATTCWSEGYSDFHDGVMTGCYCLSSDLGYCSYFGGTSASSPLAAGIAALLWTLVPSLGNEDIEQVLIRTAMDKGTSGWDPQYGWGLVRADAAMNFVHGNNVFETESATGFDSFAFTGIHRTQKFRNVPGMIGTPNVWRETIVSVWKLSKTVSFTNYNGQDPLEGKAWARGRLCSAWKDTTYYDWKWEANWAKMENIGNETADVYGYIYQVWNADSTQFIGWFPFDPYGIQPSQISWAYAYIRPAAQGREVPDEPPAVALLAPRLWSVPGPDRTSVIHFILPVSTKTAIEIFDVSGRLIKSWIPAEYSSGEHMLPWDGLFDNGSRAGVGIYPVKLVAGEHVVAKKIVLY
jgi:hypothetical protein